MTRSVRAAPPTARVELRVAPRSGRRALLSVRSSGTARWSIPVARSRVLRLPMPVRNGRVRIRFRARRGSVQVQVRRVSS
ncbi:MAG: hypothetical protein ACXVFL_17310, partial [Solirubrobacteraceae bacterium]